MQLMRQGCVRVCRKNTNREAMQAAGAAGDITFEPEKSVVPFDCSKRKSLAFGNLMVRIEHAIKCLHCDIVWFQAPKSD